jgi:hypothetical protein
VRSAVLLCLPHASVCEDLGVQVFATETPFRLPMPVLSLDNLAGDESSEFAACPPISLERVTELSLDVGAMYHVEASCGMVVHVRASTDGINFNTEDGIRRHDEHAWRAILGQACRH